MRTKTRSRIVHSKYSCECGAGGFHSRELPEDPPPFRPRPGNLTMLVAYTGLGKSMMSQPTTCLYCHRPIQWKATA